MLSIASPVLQPMVCGKFRESIARRIELDDVDIQSFQHLLDLWCGRQVMVIGGLEGLIQLAALANRFQVSPVEAVLEAAISERLDAATCTYALAATGRWGLSRAEAAARRVAVERFDEAAQLPGFLRLGEEAVSALLADDALVVRTEEAVFEAAARWMARCSCRPSMARPSSPVDGSC